MRLSLGPLKKKYFSSKKKRVTKKPMAIPPKSHHKRNRRKQIIWFLLIRTIGNFLILFTIFGVSATFGPALYFEVRYEASKYLKVNYKVGEIPTTPQGPSELGKIIQDGQKQKEQPSLFDAVLSGSREEILYPQDPAFSVVIPKIGANEKIVANVDPDNEKEYLNVLLHNIAHAKGTAFPGVNGTTYLFAHSTDDFWNVGRYNAVFYLLNKMEKGDEVVLFFNNKRYNYIVSDKKIVDPDDTHFVAANLGQGEQVILQTCWPPGTAWKRLLIFANPKQTISPRL
jgi:sortase A